MDIFFETMLLIKTVKRRVDAIFISSPEDIVNMTFNNNQITVYLEEDERECKPAFTLADEKPLSLFS